MSLKLYELSQNYQNLQELMENEDVPAEMLKEALDAVGDEIEKKAEGIAQIINVITGYIDMIKKEKARLDKTQKTYENKVKYLKQYLQDAMQQTGKTKFKTNLFSFGIQKNPASVNITDVYAVPTQFREVQEPKLNKKAILEALKNGEEIAGAEIVQGESLRIR